MSTRLDHIDERVRAVILSAPSQTDQRALRAILQIIGNTKRPEKRAAQWLHFEQSTNARMRPLVAELHRAFDIVDAEEQSKAADFDAWLQAARSGSLQTVDGR